MTKLVPVVRQHRQRRHLDAFVDQRTRFFRRGLAIDRPGARNSLILARNSISCAISSGVELCAVASAAGASDGAATAISRPFLLTIRGAMIARSTLTEPQAGQLTRLRFSWLSYAAELWNQLSKLWPFAQRKLYR